MINNEPFPVSDKGFTFIEILLTVMIVAGLAVCLFSVFAAGMKLESRAKSSFANLDEERLVGEHVQKDLGRVIYFDFRGTQSGTKCFSSDGNAVVFLIEKNDEMKWVRYRLTSLEPGKKVTTKIGTVTDHNVSVTNSVTRHENRMFLVRDENDFSHLFNGDDIPQKQDILSRRISPGGLTFFWGVQKDGLSGLEWKSSWEKHYPPFAARVQLKIAQDGKTDREWSRDYFLPMGGRDGP